MGTKSVPMSARHIVTALSSGLSCATNQVLGLSHGSILSVNGERHDVDLTGPTRCHVNPILKISYPDLKGALLTITPPAGD